MNDRPDSFDTKAFLEFCRSKPAGEEYNYANPYCCALTQFGKQAGRPGLVSLGPCEIEEIDPDLEEALNPSDGRMTFGALADRLAKLVEPK